MKKHFFLLLVPLAALIAAGAVVADSGQGKSDQVYVISESQPLRVFLGKNHDFQKFFSTKNSAGARAMTALGLIEVEPVQTVQALGEKTGHAAYQGVGDYYASACVPDNQYPWGINKVAGGFGGSGILAAVLDTGVDTDHPDLLANIAVCKGIGYGTCEDGDGHGTHVAGTILANGLIKGVAPEAKLMALKVLDDNGGGYASDVAAGIIYAADNGASIISMSLGADRSDLGMKNAVEYALSKGVLLVAAAGNDGPRKGTIDYPGAYAGVIAAGAIDANEAVADFSSRGITDYDDSTITDKEIEFAAPGVAIESTLNNGCYAYYSGTSMAAPHVSGLAAILWQGSADGTRAYLKAIAKDIYTAGYDIATGYGLPIASSTPVVPECAADSDCGDKICCNDSCVIPICLADSGCDDNNSCTNDICANAGACAAICEHIDTCGPVCGDGVCSRPQENKKLCPADCGK